MHQDAPAARSAKLVQVARPIAGQYVVVLVDGGQPASVAATAGSLTQRYGGTVLRTYGAVLPGFAARLSAEQARQLAADPSVKYVEEDGAVEAAAVQSNAPWALDRIDQRPPPLDGSYAYPSAGVGIHVYVIDSGIRATHAELAGRVAAGFGAVKDGGGTGDCNGHGTAVASVAAGATYGVAKGATVHPVRVFGCDGTGTVSAVLAGIDWVTSNATAPAVASLSFAGAASPALDAAVEASIGAGVTYVVAAGNDGHDACGSSPARVARALTVSAAGLGQLPGGASTDVVWPSSNQGPCVDLFAPGVGVSAATVGSDTATATFDGTSIAAAHVAGAVALFLERHPTSSPMHVADALLGNATLFVAEGLVAGTPNRFLYTGFLAAGQADGVSPTVSITAPGAGSTLAGSVTFTGAAQDSGGTPADPSAVSQVAWSVDGVFVGASTGSPYPVVWDSSSVANGTHVVAARAYDQSGNSGEAQVIVTVANPTVATFDPALGVPSCRAVGERCASGLLLDGRAGLGPEANSPNTLLLPCADGGTTCQRQACTDGASGSYHVDESLDAIEVRTVDGGPFAAGKVVEVRATAWSYTAYASDALDLWFASDATAPVWTYLGTLPSAGAGKQTYTYRYTLPAGALQALRGVFRYGGTYAACSGGVYDDHDDLAFAVGPGTADRTRPTVSLDEPTPGATVSSLTSLAATATDDTVVARVEFYADGALIGADSVAPYELLWNADTLTDGSHVLKARAYDGSGNFQDSAEVKVTVKDLVAPTVAIAVPTPGAVVGGDVLVAVQADDNRGVTSVSLVAGGATLAQLGTEPYEAFWHTRGLPDGTYAVRATAVDAQGNVGTSASVSVTLDNTAPLVSVTAPGGAPISGPIVVDVSAVDANGIASIELYAGDALVGTCGASPCEIHWNTSTGPNGTYTLVAKATDLAGNVGTSAPVTVQVLDGTPPTVALVAPAAGYLRGTVTVSAAASDPNGAVVLVRFLAHTAAADTVIGEDAVEPYRLDWDTRTIADGSYDLVARAFDGAGNSSGSVPVTVTVDNTPPVAVIAAPLAASDLGSVVKVTVVPTDAAMDHVDLYVDATLVATITSPASNDPWSAWWDTTWFDNGAHSLVARAFDKAGNEGDSMPIQVTVHNGSTADYDATLLAPRCSAVAGRCFSGTLLAGRGSVGPEPHSSSTASNTIAGSCPDGALGTFHVDESNDALLVTTLPGAPPGQLLAPGTPVEIDATVWGARTDGTDEVDFYYAADANAPTWVYLDTKPVTVLGAQTLKAYYTLPTGGLQAVRVNYRFGTVGPSPCTPGDYNDHDDLVFPTSQGPDTTPPTVTVTTPVAGGTVNGMMVIQASAADDVGLARVEIYAGMTLLAAPTAPPFQATWDTTTFADGALTISAIAYDTSGNTTTSTAVPITVANVPNASFDAALGAPRCTQTASFCAAGGLFVGRGVLGPEPNHPNTIIPPGPALRCPDGSAGLFHVDESIDALRVYTQDGQPITAGIPVTVEATVWAYAGYDQDHLDLYAAADVTSPSWRYLGTFQPAGAGPQVLSTQFVLPAGGVQVVRAHYRYAGTPAACGTGSYDDHDDLAFAVDANVAYDTKLGAPSCSRVAAFCDSGSLLVGRASLGPEPNAPNTLVTGTGKRCADGTAGTFHVDPSVDAIHVGTLDGAQLAAGKTVRVDAKVWASSAWKTEALDVYSASDATSPSWTYVGTLQPSSAGAQTLSVSYALPTGARQAVRAHYRNGGTAASCGSGSIDDHDDLVFAVAQ
jgi:subtilisin family serine protease